ELSALAKGIDSVPRLDALGQTLMTPLRALLLHNAPPEVFANESWTLRPRAFAHWSRRFVLRARRAKGVRPSRRCERFRGDRTTAVHVRGSRHPRNRRRRAADRRPAHAAHGCGARL